MYHILTQFEGSFQRTIVYQTRYENNIAFIQQRKGSSISSWTTFDHCLIPKKFIDFVTTLPNITEEGDFINNSTPSETGVTSQNIPNPLTSDIWSLPMDIKRILRSYDFESMPLFRSHEEYFAALEGLENMWKKLESCRIETKLTTIHDKIDHTTSSTPDDNRKTVISSILERFPSLPEENSKIEENFQKLSTEPSANNALRKRSQSRVVGGCVIHSGNFPKRMRFDENVRCSCDNNN